MAKKTNHKERGNVDIMDFDFNAVSISDSPAAQLQSDPMDLLGGAPTPQPSQGQNQNSFNLFESAGTQPVSTSTPPNNLLPDNKQAYSNFSLTGQPPKPTQQPATLNYQQTYNSPAVQDLNFMGLGSQPQTTPTFLMPQSNPESKQVQLDIAVSKEVTNCLLRKWLQRRTRAVWLTSLTSGPRSELCPTLVLGMLV